MVAVEKKERDTEEALLSDNAVDASVPWKHGVFEKGCLLSILPPADDDGQKKVSVNSMNTFGE